MPVFFYKLLKTSKVRVIIKLVNHSVAVRTKSDQVFFIIYLMSIAE